jgi:hypothetical protein
MTNHRYLLIGWTLSGSQEHNEIKLRRQFARNSRQKKKVKKEAAMAHNYTVTMWVWISSKWYGCYCQLHDELLCNVKEPASNS